MHSLFKRFTGKVPRKYIFSLTQLQGKSYCSSATEATFETEPFKLHELEQGPVTTLTLTRDEALAAFTSMQTIRRLESVAASLYKNKTVRGFCHLYSGQEAVAVGIEAVISRDDAVITSYRAHGWTFTRGVSVHGVLAELAGRETGCSKGKGGSMHMFAHNFYGGNGIVAAQVPVGTGVAFANKYQGKNDICVTLYGDGAANQGQVYESYNIAKLWDIPVVYVCENNGYGMGTSVGRSSACQNYYARASYIPGLWVDGMDYFSVRSAMDFAKQYALKSGPILMECATYRYHGHSMSDPGTAYRSREEVQEVRDKRDPIVLFKEKITGAGLVTQDELKAIEVDIRKQADEAGKAAKSDPELPLEAMFKDIYVEQPKDLKIRGCDPTIWARTS